MTQSTGIKEHIRAEDIRDCALFSNAIVYRNPHETIIPEIHNGPSIFYTKTPLSEGWVVRRHETLRKIYSDAENFHKKGASGFARMIGEDWAVIPTELDPPIHSSFRAALNPMYSPSRMASLDQSVRQRAQDLIGQFKATGGCEFIQDFAVSFPVSIFLDLIGLPQDRTAEFLNYETALLRDENRDHRTASVLAVKQILLDAIAERKKNPTDDLISQTLALEVDGRPWSDREVFGHCFNLYLGGLDTVTANLGLHFHHLATHVDDQQTMRSNSFTQNVVAVEEFLRAYAAVTTVRLVSRRVEVEGVTMMPGDTVYMSTPLAGRDPEAYEDVNEVKLDRKPAHVTLGHGIHRCLGQHLARRELQIAIDEFLKAIPEFQVETGYQVPFHWGNIIHVSELPLVWR